MYNDFLQKLRLTSCSPLMNWRTISERSSYPSRFKLVSLQPPVLSYTAPAFDAVGKKTTGGVVVELVELLPFTHPISGSNIGHGASCSGFLKGGRTHCGSVNEKHK